MQDVFGTEISAVQISASLSSANESSTSCQGSSGTKDGGLPSGILRPALNDGQRIQPPQELMERAIDYLSDDRQMLET